MPRNNVLSRLGRLAINTISQYLILASKRNDKAVKEASTQKSRRERGKAKLIPSVGISGSVNKPSTSAAGDRIILSSWPPNWVVHQHQKEENSALSSVTDELILELKV